MNRKIFKILSIIFITMLLTSVFGCGFNKNSHDAESVVKGFLSAVSKDDTDKAKTFLVNPGEYESLTTVAKNMGMDEAKTKKFTDQYTSIKYNIEKTVKGSDATQATVMVFMTIPDYSKAFADGLRDTTATTSDAMAVKAVIEKMADTKPVVIQKAIAVNVVKKDNSWLIDYSNNNIELNNAINGNILNALHGSLSV